MLYMYFSVVGDKGKTWHEPLCSSFFIFYQLFMWFFLISKQDHLWILCKFNLILCECRSSRLKLSCDLSFFLTICLPHCVQNDGNCLAKIYVILTDFCLERRNFVILLIDTLMWPSCGCWLLCNSFYVSICVYFWLACSLCCFYKTKS